jgi:hypothetical protein
VAAAGLQPHQQATAAGAVLLPGYSSGLATSAGREQPPAGCLPDAIKLYVGSLPPGLKEAGLRQLLVAAGHVVRLELHPPVAGSKAGPTASVWYATRQQALQAMQQFHMRVVVQFMGRSRGPVIVRPAAGWELPLAEHLPDVAFADYQQLQHVTAQSVQSSQGLMRPGTAAQHTAVAAAPHTQLLASMPAAGYHPIVSGGLEHGLHQQQHYTQHHQHQQHQQWYMLPVDGTCMPLTQQQAPGALLSAVSALPCELPQQGYGTTIATQHSLAHAALLVQQQAAGAYAPEQGWQAGPAAHHEHLAADPSMHLYVPLGAQQQQQQQQQQAAALLSDQLAGSLQLHPTAGPVPGSAASHMQYIAHLQR